MRYIYVPTTIILFMIVMGTYAQNGPTTSHNNIFKKILWRIEKYYEAT